MPAVLGPELPVAYKKAPEIMVPAVNMPKGRDVGWAKIYVPTSNAVLTKPIGELVQVAPSLVSTFPAVPGATNCTALVPLPSTTELAVNVLVPVPPLDTGTGVPEYVSAKVPVVVTGLPVTVNAAGAVSATD